MTAANPHRGEVPVELVTPSGDRQTFTLRPSWQALSAIEETMGKSVVAIADRFSSQDADSIAIRDYVTMTHAFLRAGGHDLSRDQVGEMVYATGILTADYRLAVLTALMNGLTGGQEVKATGEAKAPGSTDTTTGATGA